MKLAENCAGASAGKLYTIGFSSTKDRIVPGRVEIPNQNMTYKRWSEGVSTGRSVHKFLGEGIVYLEGTTVDVLGGGLGRILI